MLMSNDSVLTYCEALDQAICDQMHFDSTIFVYGVETNMFGSLDKVKRQHKARVITTPISEDALAGFGFGSAITGLRPVFVHIRSEFFTLCMNQIVNVVSSHSYSTLGESSVPLFIRVVIGRGWGQGYQHSKSLMSVFAHIPGLIVTAPTTPSDAWNMTKASLTSRNPVIQFEHRWLYWQKGEIEAEADPIGKSNHRRKGTDVTIVAISWMNVEAIQAADFLKEKGAKSARAAVVHPVLSGSALEKVNSSSLDELIVTNTIPLGDKPKICEKIKVLSVAPIFAKAIQRIHNGDSVSVLF